MRYLKVVLSSVLLVTFYMWVALMFNSCNSNNSGKEVRTEVEADDSLMSDDEFESDTVTDGEFVDETSEEDKEVVEEETVEEDGSEPGDYTTPTFPIEEKKSVEKRTHPVTNSSANTGAPYMVIAGSYLMEDNAKNMIKKLQSKGYSNAEIVHFNFSQYHSICAGRYNSKNTAQKTVNALQASGISAYVHKRQ